MKYLEILRNYDKAIVTESEKLNSIYKQLLSEGCCEKEDALEEDQNSNADKPQVELEEAECDEATLTPPGEYYADDKDSRSDDAGQEGGDQVDDVQPQANVDDVPPQDGGDDLMSRESFFGVPEKKDVVSEDGEDDDAPEGQGDSAEGEKPHGDTSSSDDNGTEEGGVMTASELFSKAPDAAQSEGASDSSEGDSDGEAQDAEGEKANESTAAFNNAKEWFSEVLGETKDEDDKAPTAEGDSVESQNQQKKTATITKPSDNEGNKQKTESATTTEPSDETEIEDDEDDEETTPSGVNGGTKDGPTPMGEEKQLQESIEAIRQFVKANKKLFYIEK